MFPALSCLLTHAETKIIHYETVCDILNNIIDVQCKTLLHFHLSPYHSMCIQLNLYKVTGSKCL